MITIHWLCNEELQRRSTECSRGCNPSQMVLDQDGDVGGWTYGMVSLKIIINNHSFREG